MNQSKPHLPQLCMAGWVWSAYFCSLGRSKAKMLIHACWYTKVFNEGGIITCIYTENLQVDRPVYNTTLANSCQLHLTRRGPGRADNIYLQKSRGANTLQSVWRGWTTNLILYIKCFLNVQALLWLPPNIFQIIFNKTVTKEKVSWIKCSFTLN